VLEGATTLWDIRDRNILTSSSSKKRRKVWFRHRYLRLYAFCLPTIGTPIIPFTSPREWQKLVMAEANEELLLESKGKNTTRPIKDFSPAGIRLEDNLEGESMGVYNASFYGIEIDYVRLPRKNNRRCNALR
jgi:hypothetical protein